MPAKYTQVQIQCRVCKIYFFVQPNRVNSRKHCSRVCAAKGSNRRVIKPTREQAISIISKGFANAVPGPTREEIEIAIQAYLSSGKTITHIANQPINPPTSTSLRYSDPVSNPIEELEAVGLRPILIDEHTDYDSPYFRRMAELLQQEI